MAKRAELTLETAARNAFYRDDGRRAWALIAFMVEHEHQLVGPDGTKQQRTKDIKERMVFRVQELYEQFLPASAGFGGYSHPRAPSHSRTYLVQEMAKDAEREGWITRELDRNGGTYNYALTKAGPTIYRDTIEPQRIAFVRDYLEAAKTAAAPPALPSAKEPAAGRVPGGDADKEERIAALQKLYEKGGSLPDRHRPTGPKRG